MACALHDSRMFAEKLWPRAGFANGRVHTPDVMAAQSASLLTVLIAQRYRLYLLIGSVAGA